MVLPISSDYHISALDDYRMGSRSNYKYRRVDNSYVHAPTWIVYLLLAAAYSIGDLSQVYPIMRGTSPLLVPLLGITLLNESYLHLDGLVFSPFLSELRS